MNRPLFISTFSQSQSAKFHIQHFQKSKYLEKRSSLLFDQGINLLDYHFVNYWLWTLRMKYEKTALFIDGSNFYAATRLLNMDIDYANLHKFFSQDTNLIRAYYYTALPEDNEFSPLRPLIDWLDYNGFAVISKLTREYIDPETGKKRTKGNMDMELALDMLKLAPHIDHAVLFSGDGDFCRLLEDVQGMGVRVSVVSTTKTSPPMAADSLRRMADIFVEMENLRDYIARPARQNDEAAV
jgi:uncharacterized LabA/DUF88 family protein